MKKLIRAVITLWLGLSFALPAIAGSESSSKVDFYNAVNSSSMESPNLLHASKIDGVYASIPGAYRNNLLGDKNLPKLLRDLGYRIFTESSWHKNGVSVRELENLSTWWNNSQTIASGIMPSAVSDNRLMLLSYWPNGEMIKEVAESKNIIEDEADIPNSILANAMLDAWNKGGHPKYYTVLYRIKDVTHGDVLALGTAAVSGFAHGPAENAGERVTTGAIGSGIGTAESFVWKGLEFLVVGWNQIPENKTTLAQKNTDINFSEIPSQALFFEFDSWEISTEKQYAAAAEHAEKIRQTLPKLKANEYIYIVGGTSQEGSFRYNDYLGQQRAKTEADLLIKLLNKTSGLDTAYLQAKIKHCSMGKHFPDYKQIPKNQRNYLVLVKKL